MLQHTQTPTCNVAPKVTESWPTGPHSLPTEIVQMIFQFVFESCTGSSLSSKSPALWLDEDPLSSFLFPYSLACVCLRWFRILKTYPIYWTRQVITVDIIATSLNAARTMLEWAGNLPLKVIVTRHHGTSETLASERTNVGHAMQLLRPYISRIWSLSFDLEHRSSIPALWRESGRARQLKVLTLMGRFDASRISSHCESSHEYEGKLEVPRLQQVTLNSHFLKNALMAHPRLARWFEHMTALTICGDAASDGNVISLHKFLSVIDIFPSLHELMIEDIRFDGNVPAPSLFMLRPAVLRLRNITGKTALRGILPARVGRSRDVITIIDCIIHGFLDPCSDTHFSCAHLTIASMGLTARIEDLVSRWEGERLTLMGCNRVSRVLFQCLHGENAPMCLSHLRIVDCDNFSAGDVISLVKSRESQAASTSLMDVPDDDAFTALTESHVQGRGPSISLQRATWLAEHVDTFVWDTVARDGLRYVWDGFIEKLRVLPTSGSTKVRR